MTIPSDDERMALWQQKRQHLLDKQHGLRKAQRSYDHALNAEESAWQNLTPAQRATILGRKAPRPGE